MITGTKVISLGFLSVGLFLLMQVILPIVSFQLWEVGLKYDNQVLKSPVSSKSNILGVSIQTQNNFPAFISTQKRDKPSPYSEFRLTIPKINLKETSVFVDSNDLSKGLVHLPGTTLPGERGNIFISGHSAINRIFSNNAFFAKLPEVKEGDRIELYANGAAFTYKVIEIKTVDPADISVIVPPDEVGRYITLMTCVPPGLNFKRLIVLGKML